MDGQTGTFLDLSILQIGLEVIRFASWGWDASEERKRDWVCHCSVTQLCLTLCNPKDCSLPGFSVHGISQARMPEWVAMPSSRGSSRSRD